MERVGILTSKSRNEGLGVGRERRAFLGERREVEARCGEGGRIFAGGRKMPELPSATEYKYSKCSEYFCIDSALPLRYGVVT